MQDKKITINEAYHIMYEFIKQYWERDKSDELAILLGSIAPTKDGLSMDPAQYEDWVKIASKFYVESSKE